MAGDSNTRARAEMFDLLVEDGPLCLTAITRRSWGSRVELVDRVFFYVAEHRSLGAAAEQFGLTEQEVAGLIEASDEAELRSID